MRTMTSHHTEPLHRLVAAINRAGLQTPARIALEIFAPLDFLTSQVAQFVRPFTTGYRIDVYITAMTSESSWPELRALLDPEAQQDSRE